MPISILFWVLMIIWLLFGFWASYEPGAPYRWHRGGAHFLTWLMLAILGWKVFGAAIT
jgi:hypothetical protein